LPLVLGRLPGSVPGPACPTGSKTSYPIAQKSKLNFCHTPARHQNDQRGFMPAGHALPHKAIFNIASLDISQEPDMHFAHKFNYEFL
jgi:hypothetical protein